MLSRSTNKARKASRGRSNIKKASHIQRVQDRSQNQTEMDAEEAAEMQKIEGIFARADAAQSLQSTFTFNANPATSFSCSSANNTSTRKFNRDWRTVFGDGCSGLPISSLLRGFHKRYGIVPHCHNPPWSTAQHSQNFRDTPAENEEDKNSGTVYMDSLSIEQILARLPMPSLMRAKSVCKAWRETISRSQGFWSLCESLNSNPGSHNLVAQHTSEGSHGIVLFNPSLNRWFRIPLDWKWTYSPLSVLLCAAGGGLLLFCDWNSGENYNLVVLNPLTKQHRVLPDFPLHQGWDPEMAVELIIHQGSNRFEIVVIARHNADPSNICALVYDSRTDAWTSHATGVPYPSFLRSPWRSTVYGGAVYCTNTYGLHMVCYEGGKFRFLEIEGLPHQVDFSDLDKNPQADLPSVVVCDGRVLFVGRLQTETWMHHKGFALAFKGRDKQGKSILGRLPLVKHNLLGLWELDFTAKSWSLVAVSPRDLLESVVKTSEGTDLLVASDGTDRIWFMLRGSANLLGFNLSSMEWSLLNGCPGEDIMDPSPRRAFSTPLRISPHL